LSRLKPKSIMITISPDQQDARRAQHFRRDLRRHAREIARHAAATALDQLSQTDPPAWFDAEQVRAYLDELRRLRDRTAPCNCTRMRGPG
jgi:hypothetical protein